MRKRHPAVDLDISRLLALGKMQIKNPIIRVQRSFRSRRIGPCSLCPDPRLRAGQLTVASCMNKKR